MTKRDSTDSYTTAAKTDGKGLSRHSSRLPSRLRFVFSRCFPGLDTNRPKAQTKRLRRKPLRSSGTRLCSWWDIFTANRATSRSGMLALLLTVPACTNPHLQRPMFHPMQGIDCRPGIGLIWDDGGSIVPDGAIAKITCNISGE